MIKKIPVDLTKIYLKISYKTPIKNDLFTHFLRYINNMIGAKTTSNYHVVPIYENEIYIPIFPYTSDEMKLEVDDLVKIRIDNIKKYFNDFDWKLVNKTTIWCVRSLIKQKIDVFNGLRLTLINDNDHGINNTEELKIKPLNKIKHKLKKIIAKDGSIITMLIDPLNTDYGIFIDFSIPFDEMGFSYNALHLYEHLLTKMWKNVNATEVADLNGATFPTGISYVYTIHDSLKSFQNHVKASLIWLLKSRNIAFWETDDMKKDIEMETIRTISETRNERTMNSMGRSDSKAFDIKYNTDIFKYWANKPFNILVTVKTENDWKLTEEFINNLVEKYKINDVPKPEIIQFKHIPIETLKMKKIRDIHTKKIDINVLKQNVLNSQIPKGILYGLDSGLICNSEDISYLNTVLFPLLFLSKSITSDEQTQYLEDNVIPFSSKLYTLTPLGAKNFKNCLEFMNEN